MALHPNSGGPAAKAHHPADPDYVPECEQCGDPDPEGWVTPDNRYLCRGCTESEVESWGAAVDRPHDSPLDTVAEWAEWVLAVAKTMTPGSLGCYETQIRAARLIQEAVKALEE